jgi:hypothetical protein
MHDTAPGVSGYVLLLIVQIVFIVLFGICTDYDDNLKPKEGKQSEDGFTIPKYARKTTNSTATHTHKLSLISTYSRFRFPRYSRNDFHRFRLSDDLPQAIRLQCDGIKFVCGRTLHSMGHVNAWIFQHEGRHYQVSLWRTTTHTRTCV